MRGSVSPLKRPTRLRTAVAVTGWPTLLLMLATLVVAYAVPQRLTDTGRRYDQLAAAAFFGRVFTFHLGLMGVALACVAAVARRWRLAGLSAAAALVALWPAAVACVPHSPRATVGRPVRFMTMNVKYSNRDAADLVAQVRRFNPDVLCVEELGRPPQRALDAALTADYPFRSVHAGAGIGLALYSKLPFEAGRPQLSFGRVRRQLRAVVRVGDQPVALYVVHPLSPRSLARLVANRLATADLVDQLTREKLPAVVAGDFNFTADTPNAAALTRAGLTDAFDQAGNGRGATWPVRPRWAAWLPGVRIDHVYLSPTLAATAYATAGYTGSDHLPIVADVALARP